MDHAAIPAILERGSRRRGRPHETWDDTLKDENKPTKHTHRSCAWEVCRI